MQMVIEISEESYNKLTAKSMMMSASAIDEAVDAIKKGGVLSKHGKPIDVDVFSNAYNALEKAYRRGYYDALERNNRMKDFASQAESEGEG